MRVILFVVVPLALTIGWASFARASLRAYRLASAVAEGEVRAWCAGRSRAYNFHSSVPFFVVSIAPGEVKLAVCGTFRTDWIELDPAEVELTWLGERLTKVREPSSKTVLYVRACDEGVGLTSWPPASPEYQ